MRTVILMLVLGATQALSGSQAPLPADKTVKVGDAVVDGSFLKPYKNAWQVFYAFPGKEPFLVGTWSDEVSEIEVRGRHLLKRTQVANYAKYHITNTTINVFDPKTMAPVSNEFTRSDTGEWAHRDFDGDLVKYERQKDAQSKKEKGQLRMGEPIFDYDGGMYGVLLSAFPLKEDFAATIPALSENRDAFEWVTFKVGKQEMVDAGPGKKVLAWPVTVDAPDKSHSIFWVSKETPYVIKLVTIIPTGGWVTVTMTMI